MSSSIHYKFRTTNVSKTLAFDGQSIKVPELKKAICAAENIKAELFDLIFFNSFNKQPYTGDDEIPRNSSVTVQRVPIENGAKIPKISNPEISAATKATPDVPDSAAHIKQEDFSKMTEEERIKHIRIQSTFKYTTNNYNRKPMANNMQQAPPDYLCNRCNQLGHFPKACPLLNIRKTTGIPNEELMETTADDPQAMLHPSGKFMIPIMHYKAREQRKLMEEQKKNGLTSSQEQKNKSVKKELPSELKCPLCNNIFKEALVTGCCGESFCADCIQQTMSDAIAADLNSQCPNCKAPIGASALFPNNSLRESVDKYKKALAASTAAPEGSESDEDEIVTNEPETVSSPETPQQAEEEKTPEQVVEVLPPVVAEVEKPVVLPTVNLSAMLAATQKPKQSSLPPPEPIVDFSQPPPTVLSQPLPSVIPTPVVPIVDFSKPPPNFKLPDLSQPPPFISSNIPKINKEVILPLPQSFNVPPPKPILSEPKYDEKDEEAINSVWEKLNVGDDNLDLATLFDTRASYVTKKDDKDNAKEKEEKEKRTKRHRSKSHERHRRENHRSRSRSPHKKRKESREREASSSKKRSKETEYRHKSIEKRSSDYHRKDKERENGNGKERNEDKERKEVKRKSDEQKESLPSRDRERSRKYGSDDDKKMLKLENEAIRVVKNEKESKKEKEKESKPVPKMPSESPKKKELFTDIEDIKKASSSSQETISRIEIKEREKEKEKKKDKVVKEKERQKSKDNGKEREKEKKKEKEREYVEKSEKKKSSKKDKSVDTVEREKDKEKKKSSIKDKKKSKSEEKKKKKRRKSSDRSDEEEEKQKKKRHKEKKHKKDRKRMRESIDDDDDDDSEDDRRKRRKF